MNLVIVDQVAFARGWRGGTQRLLDLAGGMSERGWDVTLLRAQAADEDRALLIGRSFPGRVLVMPFAGSYPQLLDRPVLRKLYRHLWRALPKQVRGLDPREGWSAHIANWVRRQSHWSAPDAVWGISYGRVGSLFAAQVLAKEWRAPLVLELQDPVPPAGKVLPNDESTELKSCLQSAQAIVVTTSSYATGIVQQHPTLDGKVHAVYLCYDDRQPVQATRPRDPGKVVLLHAGHLHGGVGRNARGLLRALAKTCEIHPGARELIRLELLGAGPGGYEALRTAEDLGIAAMVKVLDEVPPDDCRARMDAADVLVVIKFEDEAFNSQIPGKLFQYFGRGKPILGVMGECEAAEILRRTGLGINAPASDTGALSAAICRLVLNDRGRPPLVPDWSYVRSFSRTAMLNKLAGVLQTACGGIAGGGPEPLRLPGRNTPHACRDS